MAKDNPAVRNAYRDKPVMGYQKTIVSMQQVINYIRTLQIPLNAKRVVYSIFRNEGANGQAGINQNYCGIQADGARLGVEFDTKVVGTVIIKENGVNGKLRRFCAFADFKASIDYLAAKVMQRGLYIGSHIDDAYADVNIVDTDSLELAYVEDWVAGNKLARPTQANYASMESLYQSAIINIPV